MTSLSDAARDYLDEIDATGFIRERVDRFVSIYDSLYQDGLLTHLLITDSLDEEEGTRTWNNLWFYGSDHAAECKNFLFVDNWDMARVPNVHHWSMQSSAYAPNVITDESRMNLTWTDNQNVVGSMSATGTNCVALTKFLRDFVLRGSLSDPSASPASPRSGGLT